MPDDTITLVSTTDTPEQVQAALAGKPVDTKPETKTADAKPGDTPANNTVPPATDVPGETKVETIPPGEETPEQTEEREKREASEAGSRLAKRKNKIQDEIDDLTSRKHAARRDVEAEESRLFELRRQREAVEAEGKKAETPPAEPEKKPAGREEPKLDAVDDKGNAKYATYEEYLSDHAKWIREEAILEARRIVEEERTAERERIGRESAARAVNEGVATYHQKLDDFKKTHADFDAAFEDAKESVQETLVALGPQALKIVDGYTVFDAEDGPALTYYLLKHPEELKAIVTKAPPQQLVHLARLEERIRPTTPKRTGTSVAAVPETKAPEPIKPVGSGPTATTVPLDEASYQDYKQAREREIRKRHAS